jgi:uncharacterized protein (TIGR00661 family)
MKILYGVQATGNGHITRARVIAEALEKTDIEVDWVFSGRDLEDFFDMEAFSEFKCFRGMTFVVDDGRINFVKTALGNNLFSLVRDAQKLDVSDYDLVISDFEPVTAWAAKWAKKQCIGISHQSSFLYDIPKKHSNFFTDLFMRYFAPTDLPVGIHWHHFDGMILPPIVEESNPTDIDDFVLVYLPFVYLESALKLLDPHSGQKFVIYAGVSEPMTRGDHIQVKPFCRVGFQRDLRACRSVISGGGFELPSEALHLGKRLLVQPVKGQMEQQSNGLALAELGLATVVDDLSEEVIRDWLTLPVVPRRVFPHTAAAFVEWLVAGDWNEASLLDLKDRLWQLYQGESTDRQHLDAVNDAAVALTN